MYLELLEAKFYIEAVVVLFAVMLLRKKMATLKSREPTTTSFSVPVTRVIQSGELHDWQLNMLVLPCGLHQCRCLQRHCRPVPTFPPVSTTHSL
jgi:hypothetical protein